MGTKTKSENAKELFKLAAQKRKEQIIKRGELSATVKVLKEKGFSNKIIARLLELPESVVRSLQK